MPPPTLINDISQRYSHRHFHQAGIFHLAHQRKYLGAFALLRADGSQELGSVVEISGMLAHVSTLLILVGLSQSPFTAGYGGLGLRLARLAFQRSEQSRFLAAYESAGSAVHFDGEIKTGAQDILAEKPILLSLLDGDGYVLHGQRVFLADIDVSFMRADRIGPDGRILREPREDSLPAAPCP